MKHDTSTLSWDKVGKEWCEFAQTGDFRIHFIMPYTMEQLKDVSGKKILDIGCGDGGYSRALAHNGATLTSVDCSSDSIDFAKQKAIEKGLNITHHVRNSNDLYDIDDSTFDIVLCSMMLMDCEDFDGTVREIKRVLKKNGKIFISVLHPCFNGKEIRWSKDDEGNTEVKVKDYYSPNTWEDKISRSVQTNVIWRHRTLQDYFKMFIKYDLQLIDFNEPIPTQEQILKSDRIKWLMKIPMFLFIELKK